MTSAAEIPIGKHILRGAAWMVAMRWLMRGIGLINTVVLARVLSPDDFGLMAMAAIMVELLMMLADTNVDVALLRDPSSARQVYDSAWTVQAIFGLGVAGLVALAAPLLVIYYHDPRVATLMYILALRPAILGFENVGVVEFRKTLDFAKEFRYSIFRRLSLLLISLVLAVTLRNYLALAIAAPISAVITVIFSFIMSSYRPRLSLAFAVQVWGASRWMILQSFAQVALDRADEFVIGGVFNATAVGNYYIAGQVAPMPTREIAWPLERALLPTFAKIKEDSEELRKSVVAVMGVLGAICFPAGIGMAVVARSLVLTIFGDHWGATIPFFRWLAVFGIFAALGRPLMPLFYVLNRERLYALLSAGQVAVTFPAVMFAAHALGLIPVAATRTLVGIAFFMIFFGVMLRLTSIRLSDLAGALWRPMGSAMVMALALTVMPDDSGLLPFIALVRDVVLGLVVYVSIDLMLWWFAGCPDGAERLILSRVGPMLGLPRGLLKTKNLTE